MKGQVYHRIKRTIYHTIRYGGSYIVPDQRELLARMIEEIRNKPTGGTQFNGKAWHVLLRLYLKDNS